MRLIFTIYLLGLFAFFCGVSGQVETITQLRVHNQSPEKIYQFLLTLTPEKYLQWHPDHREFKVIKSTKEITGSIFYFREEINGFKSEHEWKVIALQPNKSITLKTSQFGISLVIEIQLATAGADTEVKHCLKIGKGMTNWLVKFFFTEKVRTDLQQHVREEFQNLEKML